MKTKFFLVPFLIGLIFSVSLVAFALDDRGEPNDPNVNDRANACYEDGSMAGKCATEWEWVCGWYIIRYEYGLFSREAIPDTCAILLPGGPAVNPGVNPPPPPPPHAPAGCYLLSALFPGDYGAWLGNATQASLDIYTDAACANFSLTSMPMSFVSAPDLGAAMLACPGAFTVAEIVSASETGAWPIYFCA